jgi:hypothetical protein
MVDLAYPYLITHETFERDIRTLTGLGEKTLFKVIEMSYLGHETGRDVFSDSGVSGQRFY